MADGESRRLREAFVRAKTESVSQLLARDRKIASLEEKIENLLQARDEKIAKLELERESMLSAFQDIQSGFKGTFDLTKKKIDEFSKRFMTVIILD
jgi:ABC-type methionine transport system ATPase subunit